MDENKESSFLRRCPRCNNFLPLDSKECKNCGYSFEDNNKDSETLSFGMTTETSVEIFKNIEYTQAETTKLKKAQISENILAFIVGICSLLLLFLPLFAKDNFFSQCKELTNYYNFHIEDFLLYDKIPNLFNLIKSDLLFLGRGISFDASFFVGWYQMFITIAVVGMAVLGIILLIVAIRNLFFHEKIKKHKKIIKTIFIINTILIYAFAFNGVGSIILEIISSLSLLSFYFTDIFSKEKRFIKRHLIYKSICFVLLAFILVLTSYGLVNLNVVNGSNLYNTGEASTTILVNTPNVYHCKGLVLGFVELIHASIDDASFRFMATSFAMLNLFYQLGYITLLSFAIGNILCSFSRQSTRFPLTNIIVATIVFYVFAVMVAIYNHVINGIYLDLYVEKIGRYTYEVLSGSEKQSLIDANKIFTYRGGFYTALIAFLPISIFATYAKNRCYRTK